MSFFQIVFDWFSETLFLGVCENQLNMKITLLKTYSPEWLMEQSFSVGVPINDILTDEDILDQITEIQRTLRGGGIDIRRGLNQITPLEDLKEIFQDSLCETNRGLNGFFTFTSTWEGADSDAHVYFFDDMCAITFFKNNEEDIYLDTEFCYEWYRVVGFEKQERIWRKYVFHENIPLCSLYPFLNGSLSAVDIVLPEDLNEINSLGIEDSEDVDQDEIDILPAGTLNFEELFSMDEFLKLMHSSQVASFLNINEDLLLHFKNDNVVIREITYEGGKIKPFGFPQNFKEEWSPINILVCESINNEKIIGVIRKNS